MAQQKALLLLEKQGSLAIRDIDIHKPGPGELLVEVHSAGLNPVDWYIATGGYFVTDYPAVLGCDGAGIVKQVGEGVTKFKVGDRVTVHSFCDNRMASFQQYAVVLAEVSVKLPSHLSFDEGATIPLVLATAAYGLYSKLVTPPERGGAGLTPYWEEGGRGKYAGQPILVIGGASGVGQQAIQLARLSGFSPIITTASPHNASFLQTLGATHVIDRSAPLVSAVKSIVPQPLGVIYDAISSSDTQRAANEILAPGGTLILVQQLRTEITEGKKIAWVYGSVFDKSQGDLGVRLFEHLTESLENGDIKPNNVEVLSGGLAGIPDGLDKVGLGKVSAVRLVAHPQETV